MVNIYIKTHSMSMLIKKFKLNPQSDITSHLSEWLSSINPQMTSAREDIEKREPSLTVWDPIWKTVLGPALPGFRSCNPPWLRLSQRPWDHKLLRRQSLSPWQGRHLCPLYITLLGPEPDPVSYTHLTLPTTVGPCRSRWSPYH